jgi:hypothetical protein
MTADVLPRERRDLKAAVVVCGAAKARPRRADADRGATLGRAVPQISSFFELAALLIPVLMLSGYVTQRLRRTPPLWEAVITKTAGRKLVADVLVVVLFGFFPVQAEVTALSVTMSGGRASDYQTWLVALAVAFGTWSLAIALVWPWFRSSWNTGRPVRVVGTLTIVALIYLTGSTLHNGVSNQRWAAYAEQVARDDLLQTIFEINIARSETLERAFRDGLADAHDPKTRAVLKREIREEQIHRGKLLTDREASAFKISAARLELYSP